MNGFFAIRLNKLLESSVETLLQTLKNNLVPSELVGLGKENYPCLYPESKQAKNNKGNRCWECMPCCYWNLFVYFNQRSIDSLVKCTRLSLDMIKKKMQTANKYKSEGSTVESKSALVKVHDLFIRILTDMYYSEFYCWKMRNGDFVCNMIVNSG